MGRSGTSGKAVRADLFEVPAYLHYYIFTLIIAMWCPVPTTTTGDVI